MKNKKIIILALILLIIAGIIVVGLKGFNVDFMLKQHDSIEYTFNKDFEMSDVEQIAKDVFKDKKFKIRIIEFFNDAVSINAENITTEEAKQLVEKLDKKYKNAEENTTEENAVVDEATEATETTESTEATEATSEANEEDVDYEIISNPKLKLLSLFKSYIIPSVIAGIIITIYAGFRYKKLNSIKIMAKLIGLVIVTTLAILSVLAIIRFPINIYVVPCILILVLVELIIFFAKQESNLKKLKEE